MFPGVYIKHEIPDIDKIRQVIEEVLTDTSSTLGQINELITRIDKAFILWRESIRRNYGNKRKEAEKELTEIRRIVEERVNDLKKRLKDDQKAVEQRYEPIISNIKRRLREIDEEINRLNEKIKNQEGEKEEIKKYKKRIKELSKRRLELLKDLGEAENNIIKEKNTVEAHYKRLIESEQQRVRLAEEELKNIDRNLSRLISHAEEEIDTIRKMMLRIYSDLLSIYKNVDSLLISMPPSGPGKYLLPTAIVVYTGGGHDRSMIIPPLYYIIKKGFLKKPELKISNILDVLMMRYDDIYSDLYYRGELERKNLLLEISVERIEHGVRKLVEDGLFTKDKGEEFIKSIKEQIKKAHKIAGEEKR